MKRIKGILATALAVCTVFTLTACDEAGAPAGSGDSSAPSANSNATKATMKEEEASIIAEIDIGAEKLENPTVKFYASWQLNPAEGQPLSAALEMFQTQYGGVIEDITVTYDNRFDGLGALVASDDSPDMFSAGDMDIFPKGVLNKMFEPMDEYVEFDSDLWKPMKPTNDQFAFAGKHYVGAYAAESDCVMFYNKKTIEDNALPDPVELLNNDNWTWDTFWSMMESFCNREQEKFGTDGWWFEGGFSLTSGVPYVGMQDGKIVHNLDNQMIDRVQEYMYNMKINDFPFPKSEYSWEVHPERIKGGQTLFYPVGLYALYPYNNYTQNLGDKMEDIMFVPMPRCPYADAYYLPSRVSGFSIVKGAANPKGVGAYLNCCIATKDDAGAQEIGKKQAFEEYGWTQEQWDMVERVNKMTEEHPVFEMYNAVTQKVADLINNPMKESYNSAASWTQSRESIRAAVQAQLDDANAKLAEASS